MITKMNKYSFVVFHREIETFLQELQDLGMIDITRHHKAVDEHSKEGLDNLKRYDNVFRSLSSTLKEAAGKAKKSGPGLPSPKLPDLNSVDILSYTEQLLEDRLSLLEGVRNTKKMSVEAAPWGDFNYEDLKKINGLGLVAHFYALNGKYFRKEWNRDYALKVLNETGGYKYFVILSREGESYSFEYPESRLPANSSREYNEEIITTEKEIRENLAMLLGVQENISILENQRDELAGKTDLYLANVSSIRKAEDHIIVMEGFVPAENNDTIRPFLETSGVLYLSGKAVAGDNPPVKLRNNFFTRLFEPIGNLYMLPRYDELDLTPYFAPFYMLFFGFCLGDMGYGLVLTIIGTVITFVLPKFRSYGWLIMFLGIGAMIMPALNGTFFGMKLNEVFSFPEKIDSFFFSDLKMFWFAIIFGIFQIVFARLLSAIYAIVKKGWQYGLSNLGWAVLVTVLSFMYAGMEMGRDLLPPVVMKIFAGISLLLILFFSKTEGSILKRLFGGITSLYDITGFFGDMLSYIRLFGLGTAGAILGMVINSIAMQFQGIPYIGWAVTILFLIIGHIFVLALSCLGAFVHPLRLTFVEFYKNSGFTGGGKEFRPLKKETNSKK